MAVGECRLLGKFAALGTAALTASYGVDTLCMMSHDMDQQGDTL
jgi:hypothetical protein